MKMRIPLTLLAIALVAVSCGDDDEEPVPTTGSIGGFTVTTGEDIDADGYTLTVDGVDEAAIGVNAVVIVPDLTAGTYSVGLDGIATNCQTANNPRNVSVTAGATATAQFDVTCEAANKPPDEDV